MNQNYHKLCLEEIEKLNSPKKILLHSCCGPCSSYVISFLSNYFDITILYYNPNIEPFDEYNKRKEEQIKIISHYNLNIMDCDYPGLNEGTFVGYRFSNIFNKNYFRWKLKYSSDEHPPLSTISIFGSC